MTIGCLIFENQDQIDFTGPFEVLSRIPDVTVHVISKTMSPVTDIKGLVLTPNMTIAQAPQLDLLHVSGGIGQQQLMDDGKYLTLSVTSYTQDDMFFQYVPELCYAEHQEYLKG